MSLQNKIVKDKTIDLDYIIDNYQYATSYTYSSGSLRELRTYYINYTDFVNCIFEIPNGLSDIYIRLSFECDIYNCKIQNTNLYGLTFLFNSKIFGLSTDSSYIKNIYIGYIATINICITSLELQLDPLINYTYDVNKMIQSYIGEYYSDIDFSNIKYDKFILDDNYKNQNIINDNMIGKVIKINKQFNLSKYRNGYIGYKILSIVDKSKNIDEPEYFLAKLYIPNDATIINAYSTKYRANKVRLSSITPINNKNNLLDKDLKKLIYYPLFTYNDTDYKVGEYTFADELDTNPYMVCTKGIHFFASIEDAMEFAYTTIPGFV